MKNMKPDRAMEEKVKIDPGRGSIIHTPDGAEDHSQSGGPMALALSIAPHQDNLGERVRALILSERMAMEAAQAGYESFEDADDFDVDDDQYDPQTPYEEIFEGSISDDVKTRQKEQEEALKNIPLDKLKMFLGNVDKTTLDKAIKEMGMLENPGTTPNDPE